ncbi:MAG: TolB family protein [Mucilaginibacter sp.]
MRKTWVCMLLIAFTCAVDSCKKEKTLDITGGSPPPATISSKYLLFDTDLAFNAGLSTFPRYTSINYSNLDGSNINQVIALKPGYYDYRAKWSPDGKKVIFVNDNDDDSDRSLCTVDLDGNNLKTIVKGFEVDYGGFSPDGKQVVYAKSLTTSLPLQYDIYVANADGSSEQKITSFGTNGASVYDIYWASDNRIYFYATGYGYQTGIYVIDPDGNNLKYIMTDVYLLGISPDAKHILFDLGDGIYICNIDGSNIKRIVKYNNSGPDVIAGATWSPDSQLIYFSNQDYPTNYGIFSVSSDGSGLKKIMVGYYEFPQVF